MLKSVLQLQRPGRTVLALLLCLFSNVGLQQASAQEDEGFPYETLRSPVSGLRGVVAPTR